jgi:hypothetical protein
VSEFRRLAVCVGPERVDCAAEPGIPIQVSLAALGIAVDGIDTVVVGSQGRRADLAAPLASIDDGETLSVVDLRTRVTAQSARPAPGGPARERAPERARAPRRWSAWAGPVFAALAATFAVGCATVFLGWHPAVTAALLAGASPIVLRMLPGVCLDVPVEHLVDVEGNATNRWSVRGVLTGAPRPLRARAVAVAVERAGLRLSAGLGVCSASVVLWSAVLLTRLPPGGLARAAGCAGVALAALAFALAPRSLRTPGARAVPRLAAAGLLAELALWAPLPWSRGVGLAGALFAGAVIGLLAALGLTRGFRSIGFSRLGDALETLGIVLALPACLVGSGIIDLLRTAVS